MLIILIKKSEPPLEIDTESKPSLGVSDDIEVIGWINWYNPYWGWNRKEKFA